MFVTRGRFDRMEAEARALGAMAKALAEQLNKAATERDNARALAEKLTDILADERNRAGNIIRELHEAIEERDQMIVALNSKIQPRGERGRFVKKTAA